MYPSLSPHLHDKYGMTIPVPVPPESHSSPYTSSAMPGRARGSITPWSTGLCHCMDDPGNCKNTYPSCICLLGVPIFRVPHCGLLLPSSGAVYGLLCLTGMACLYSCFYRSRLRGQHDLEEGPVPDCLIHCCCEPCALCQEYRELRNRGFDMGIAHCCVSRNPQASARRRRTKKKRRRMAPLAPKTGDAVFASVDRVNAELFTLTYGAMVRQLLTDLEEVDEVNKQLDQMYENVFLFLPPFS
ncbi:hypothetical protein GW17_00028509 [Ensete ventricosum]|nr:hypothetical protein GW17_00028509 [Ensete ventricosum]